MQHVININKAQTVKTPAIANAAKGILERETTQKIIMFAAILICLVGAVNL